MVSISSAWSFSVIPGIAGAPGQLGFEGIEALIRHYLETGQPLSDRREAGAIQPVDPLPARRVHSH